jgi:hypothetical protein
MKELALAPTTFQEWKDNGADAKGAWKFDQPLVTEEVLDMTPNGANQSARNLTESVLGDTPLYYTGRPQTLMTLGVG